MFSKEGKRMNTEKKKKQKKEKKKKKKQKKEKKKGLYGEQLENIPQNGCFWGLYSTFFPYS